MADQSRGGSSQKSAVVLSCVNLKGGVGKTAISVNFAAYCGIRGLRTLLIDLDPQTNATFSCITPQTWEQHATNHGTVANLLGARQHTSADGITKGIRDVVIKDVFANVDLVPSHLDLFTIDLDLSVEVARETRLKKAVREVSGEYDIIVCDCPPNLTIPTQNAIATSTHYVVPVSLDFLSSLGVALLVTRVQRMSTALDNPLVHAGIILSRVGRPSLFRFQTARTLRTRLGAAVLASELSERSSVAESAARARPIFSMNDQKAITEFTKLGRELLAKVGLPR